MSDHFRMRAKKAPALQALERLSKKSVFTMLTLTRGSAQVTVSDPFYAPF